MKKMYAMASALVLVIAATVCLAYAASGQASSFKAGDTAYVCACGAGCDCGTVSSNAGTCGCGKELVKTSITKVENGKLMYLVSGKEMSAPATGKYACACGSGCGCKTISQKPGTCGCGQPLKKVE